MAAERPPTSPKQSKPSPIQTSSRNRLTSAKVMPARASRLLRASSATLILKMFRPGSLASLSWNDTRVDPTSAVERAVLLYIKALQACLSSLHGRAACLISYCARPTRVFQFPIPLFRGVAEAALYCAHRTSTVSSCAFCEQEGHLAAPSPSFGGRALREHRRSTGHPPTLCSGSKGSTRVFFLTDPPTDESQAQQSQPDPDQLSESA
jgi:hypothetical protein